MVSRAQLIVVTIIVAVGLMGPMAFIAQEAAKEEVDTGATPTPPPQQRKFTQVLEYTAEATAQINSVDPILIAVFVYEGDNVTNVLSNLSSASLVSMEGEPPVYRARFALSGPMDYQDTIDELASRNATVVDQGMPADITLPSTITAFRGGVAYELSHKPSDDVTAIVYGSTQSGTANFTLKITKSGGSLSIIAAEKK